MALASSDVLARLIDGLQAEAPHHLSPLELAELLWLARRCPPSRPPGGPTVAVSAEAAQPPDDLAPQTARVTPSPHAAAPPPPLEATGEEDAIPFFPPPPPRLRTPPAANLLPPEVLPTSGDIRFGLPLRLTEPALFADRFRVLRQLLPLMRRQPDPMRPWLDESETVEVYAERRILLPVLRPSLEPALRVIVLLDAGVSMEVWRPLAAELGAILASGQAFSAVEVRDFEINEGFTPPAGESQPTTLVLLLSDTAGRHWWDGRMFAELERWARRMPVVLINMLPMRWWERTAIGWARRVAVVNSQPTASNRRYRVASPSPGRRMEATSGLALPVITLESSGLALWAAMAMGNSEMAVSGILIPPAAEREKLLEEFLPPPGPAAGSSRAGSSPAGSAGERAAAERARALGLWEEFQGDASPRAQRLLMVMAAAPVLTLPIMRLLLATKVIEADTPLPLAEVLVSNLLRCTPGQRPPASRRQRALALERLQFELEPAVAELLRERLSPGDSLDVIRAVSDLIERRWNQLGTGHSFEAVLTDPTLQLPEGMEGLLHFATVTADRLDSLPGAAYKQFAQRLRQGARLEPADPFPPDRFAFEPIASEAAQLLRFPPVADFAFRTARAVDVPAETFPFTTARLEPPYREPILSPGTAQGFREWLVPPAPGGAEWTCSAVLEGHGGSVEALLALPDGRLASASADKTIRLWRVGGSEPAVAAPKPSVRDRLSGSCERVLVGHRMAVKGLVAGADGLFASSSDDGTINLWDLATGECIESVAIDDAVATTIQLGPGDALDVWGPKTVLVDQQLAASWADEAISIWDRGSRARLAVLRGHTAAVNGLASLPNGRLASCSDDGTIRIWEVVPGSCAVQIELGKVLAQGGL